MFSPFFSEGGIVHLSLGLCSADGEGVGREGEGVE